MSQVKGESNRRGGARRAQRMIERCAKEDVGEDPDPQDRRDALVPRTRSSHTLRGESYANFGFKSGTRIIELLVSFSIPKFAQRLPRMLANFGIGTLVRPRRAARGGKIVRIGEAAPHALL